MAPEFRGLFIGENFFISIEFHSMHGPLKQYDENHLYLDWLNRRGPLATRSGRLMVPVLWGITVLLYILWIGENFIDIYDLADSHNKILRVLGIAWIAIGRGIGGMMVGLVPLAFILQDFLVSPINAVQKDTERGVLNWVLLTSIPSSDVIKDLRIWVALTSLKHLLPLVLCIFGYVIFVAVPGSPSVSLLEILIYMLLGFWMVCFVWFFLFNTGISFAVLPIGKNFGSFLLVIWLFVVGFLAFYSGFRLSALFFERLLPLGINARLDINGFEISRTWFSFGLSVSILSVFSILLWFNQVRFLDLRRRFMWK